MTVELVARKVTWQPDEVAIESEGLPQATRAGLEALGHQLRSVQDLGNAPLILRDVGSDSWLGVPDARRGGAALGN